MEETPSKHRNLQHLLSAGVKDRAFRLLGEGSAAGLKVLELRWVKPPLDGMARQCSTGLAAGRQQDVWPLCHGCC